MFCGNIHYVLLPAKSIHITSVPIVRVAALRTPAVIPFFEEKTPPGTVTTYYAVDPVYLISI